jgi:hypothetical protein
VLIVAGTADTNLLAKLGQITSVSGKFINCFSKKDSLLKYLFKLVRFDTKPLGLNKIDEQGNQLKFYNYDISDLVTDHYSYDNHFY